MAAMKPRQPQTFDAGIVRAIGILGRDGAAAATNRSEPTVYAWGDPDSDKLPNIAQAFALDAACADATGETPILAVYLRMIQERGVAHDPLPPTERLLAGLSTMGRLAAEVREALDPASPGGCRVTPTEEARISSAIDGLRAELDRLERDVACCTLVPVRGTARA